MMQQNKNKKNQERITRIKVRRVGKYGLEYFVKDLGGKYIRHCQVCVRG